MITAIRDDLKADVEYLASLHQRKLENYRALQTATYQEEFVRLMNEGLRIARLIKQANERLLNRAA